MNKLVSYGFLFVGLTFALLAGPSEVEALQFAFQSDSLVETTGKVTANYTKKHQKGPDTQVVEYAYVVDGRTIHGDNHLTRLTDRPYEIDRLVHEKGEESTIAVYYMPENPEASSVRRDIGWLVPSGILLFTGFCLLVGLDGVIERKKKPAPRKTASA